MRILSVMLAIGIVCQAYGQRSYDVALIPAMLRTRADAVVRHESVAADMQSRNKVLYRVNQAVTVFNRAGENKARLVIFYNKNTVIKRMKGKVFDDEGYLMGEFSQRDFVDESAVSNFSLYEDDRVKHFLPAMTDYPYTVEYTYEVEFKQNLIIPAWRPDAYPDVAVMHSEFSFSYNPAEEVRFNAKNYIGEPAVTTVDGHRRLTWQVKNLAARRYEPYGPDPESYKVTVQVAPVAFTYYKQQGSYVNWEELGKWQYDALLADGLALPERTIQEARAMVSGLQTDKEKARALYGYMQRKTRYVSVQIGIGGFKPMVASEVDRLGYGDCKGLVNYMQALLAAVDIPSYYCVVEAGRARRDLQSDFAGMAQGNHVILCLPLPNDTTWLECTNQHIPFGYLGSFTDDRLVLACTPDGGRLMHTPRFREEESAQRRNATFTLRPDGTLDGSVETVFAAGQYENHLQIVEATGNEQQQLLKTAYDIDHIHFNTVAYEKTNNSLPVLTERLLVTLDRYAPQQDGQVFFHPNVFNRRGGAPILKSRTLPIQIDRGYSDEDRLEFTVPAGYQLIGGPMENVIETEFGKYEASLKMEGSKMLYCRKFVLHSGTFPADRYTAFSEFMNRVSALDAYKAVLMKP